MEPLGAIIPDLLGANIRVVLHKYKYQIMLVMNNLQ